LPNDICAHVGICSLREKIAFSEDSCDKYSEIDIAEFIKKFGRAYCVDCKTWIYEADMEEHRNHRVYLGVIEDEFLFEELFAAD